MSVANRTGTRQDGAMKSVAQFLKWMGPALMVSIAYMDPGNYGTDLAAGAGYRYALLWAVWLASGMAMLLQYLSGKLGIATEYDLSQLVRNTLSKRWAYIVSYWLAAEVAIAATDLAEYLGTVIALNLLFGIPLLYAAIFGALDVLLLLVMMGRRFRLVEQYFMLLIGILVIGILYNLVVVGIDPYQLIYHSFRPEAPNTGAFLVVVGIIGATVMPHALFVHSWLTKNKVNLLGRETVKGPEHPKDSFSSPSDKQPEKTMKEKRGIMKLHRNETIVTLTVAGLVNAGILLVAIPLFPNESLTVEGFVSGVSKIYGPLISILFVVTLLASGLSSSALGTIAGQAVMEGLIGKRWNIWARRIITRFVNVFPTTIAILLGLDPLILLVYSQVVLSLLIPLPMIPLVYYTSRKKIMGEFVNRKATVVLAVVVVSLILFFNTYLLLTL